MESEIVNCQKNNDKNFNYTNIPSYQTINCNKDSVNTQIEEAFQKGHNKKQHYSSFLMLKKTQIITKKNGMHAISIMRNRKVSQTLRKITKNIKSQLQRKQNINQYSDKRPQQLRNIQPQITHNETLENVFQNGSFKSTNNLNNLEPGEINCSIKAQICQQNFLTRLTQIQPYCSPVRDPIRQINYRPIETIHLFSKRKSCLQKIPVYEDRILTSKKELRNLTIQRVVDNDVSSDEEQIQMGVGYMYYELLNSCQKQNDRRMHYIAKISNNKINIKDSQNQKNQLKLQKIKQKLVFM